LDYWRSIQGSVTQQQLMNGLNWMIFKLTDIRRRFKIFIHHILKCRHIVMIKLGIWFIIGWIYLDENKTNCKKYLLLKSDSNLLYFLSVLEITKIYVYSKYIILISYDFYIK
jgi:hypothetical protein